MHRPPLPASRPHAAALTAALAALAALGSSASAQAVWAIDPSGTASQHTGPPAGPCGAPLGPLLSLWSYTVPGPCATPGALASGSGVLGVGDLGIDRAGDLLWITDGVVAAAYQPFGTPVLTGLDVRALLGAEVTGIDWDPSGGRLWVTDGTSVASAAVVFDGTCWDAVLQTSFPLPAGAYATALSHDPITDALWVVDGLGGLTHVTKQGGIGAFGSIDVVAASACGLAAPLLGVAADAAGPAGRVYVTDGALVSAVDAAQGGAAAAPTAYTPVPCYAAPLAPLEGLATAAVGALLGASSGGPFPSIGAKGQSLVPSPAFAVEIGGAQPGEIAALVLGGAFLCPSATVLGVPLNVAPPLAVVTVQAIGPTGFASVPLPIGPATPVGKTVFLQWGVIDPVTFQASSTRAMAMTTSSP